MRDPARIDRIIEKLRRFWHAVPDWRFGQVAVNLRATFAEEDDDFEERLDGVIFVDEGVDRVRMSTLTDPPPPTPEPTKNDARPD